MKSFSKRRTEEMQVRKRLIILIRREKVRAVGGGAECTA
jgi:hypothetical protein